jgi:stage II sporulation protein D
VSFSNLRAPELFYTAGTRRFNGSYAGIIVILSFLLFLAGCSRHSAQVKPPVLKSQPAPTSQEETLSAAKPQPAPSETAVRVPDAIVLEPPASVVPPPINSADIAGPLIRIGLTTEAKEIRISSSGDYYLSEKVPEASRQILKGEILLRVEQDIDEDAALFRVQVAAFTKAELAQDLKKRLSEKFGQSVVIRENTAAGLNYVQAGEFTSKEEARTFQRAMNAAGYSDAFVVREPLITAGVKMALALRGPKNFFRINRAGFLFQPSSRTAYISIDGKLYRGSFDISLNRNGRITVVNILAAEEYLLGVVPAEIPPGSYPEYAALAAQAIAARTYALKNIGRYGTEGFDLTDDTRTQVYEGVGGEKDATNEAVHRTSGLAIYYQDKLIDAMYMSTCGGRTEDVENIFDNSPVPYLRSVFCAVDSGPDTGQTILQGRHDFEQTVIADDGSVANRNLELARVLGIIPGDSGESIDFFSGPAQRTEAIQWVGNAVRIAQKTQTANSSVPEDIRTRAGFIQYAAEAFFGAAEIGRRTSPRDIDYYMANLRDGSTVPEPARLALSYLIPSGLWRPYPDNTVRPNEPIRRGDAISLLVRWVESARPDILKKAIFVAAGPIKNEADGSSIKVKWGGNRTQEFSFSRDPYLFRLDPGRSTPVSLLRIIGNEKLYFHIGPQETIDFLEIELSPNGAASDRYSPVATWDTTLTRSALSEKLRGITGTAGEIRDLKPSRIGNSGRALLIQIIGSRGSVTVKGEKVRSALGLKSTLFTIARESNPDGSIEKFVFHGHGWGHGVGLCQTGAVGMARAGRSYEEIIKTYYTGVQIRKAY